MFFARGTSLRCLVVVLTIPFLSLTSFAQYTKLHDFNIVPDGRNPHGSLISDGTFLYGMTYQGGINNLGTIFKIMPDGTAYAKLLEFDGSANGSHPLGSLLFDGTFFYGMTQEGGTNNLGVIFKVKPDGTGFVKLFDFASASNGYSPSGSLISDGIFLYGVAIDGGTNNVGTIFKIKPDGTGFAKLFDFAGGTNGSNPVGDLITDGTFLYGMTYQGGTSNLGTVYKIKPDGTGFVKLLDFAGATNGYYPKASLISDGTFLYGMTYGGGVNGFGTVFKIMPDGTGYSKLLDFDNISTGRYPQGSLISSGSFLYGMTEDGGINDKGTIFKIKPDGTGFSKLQDFSFAANGALPLGNLISDGSFLYGMTEDGGVNAVGTIFKYALANTFPTITSFTPISGPIGTSVVITGTNFSATPSGNIVFFGATQATVSAATTTQLTVTVPAGATYQPISVLVNGLTAYSNRPFVVTFADGGVINTCAFATKVDVTTGTEPYSIAIGDLDGDGKPDLAVANKVSNTVSVFKNISMTGSIASGSFASAINFTTNLNPYYVGIQDLDGDGKPELIVSNNNSDNVSIYKNITATGVINSASFAAKVDFSTGENPWNVTIADFDLDGKPDLAVVNDVSNTVSLLRNTTAGTINSTSFATKVDFAVGEFPIGIASGDLDGDGRADLVITNQADNSISVLRNTSSTGSITASSFATKVDLATGLDPYSVAIGDLNNDGKPDITVANYSSGTASVFSNASSPGDISLSSKVDFDSGSGSLTIAINDIDGDGKPDLAVSNGGSRISILKNKIASSPIDLSSFSPRVDFSSTSNPYGLAIGDLDGNGKPDIAATNFNGTTASILRNTVSSLPTFTASSFTPASGPVGTTVTLSGTNFSTTPLNNTVKFNGVTATVTSATATTLTVIVPTGATTGSISIEVGCQTAITFLPFTIITGNTITITTQPTNATACNGATATFTTAATGTTNIAYQWQFSLNVSPLVFTDISNGTNYTGTTTAALSVVTTGSFGAGRYRCKITGDLAAPVFTDGAATLSISQCTPPVISTVTLTTQVEGKITVNLVPLIATVSILDLTSIKVTKQPSSGADASITNGILTIDYLGRKFSGNESVTIEACDTSGVCSQQTFNIEVAGDVVVYNAVSPNGDDKNDFLFLQYIDVLADTKENEVTILNRWGDVVFEINNYNNTDKVFKGTNNSGKELPTGTYYYKIKFNSSDKSKTGFLYLKR